MHVTYEALVGLVVVGFFVGDGGDGGVVEAVEGRAGAGERRDTVRFARPVVFSLRVCYHLC